MKKFSRIKFLLWTLGLGLVCGGLAFAWATYQAMRPFPEDLSFARSDIRKVQVLARSGDPLTVTYQNDWNLHDYRPLHAIPRTLQQIFILAEDQRFYQHGGVDWLARFHAIAQNLMAGRIVRGASTITEQSVRMLHPRPRTFWSRWVETFEAMRLESRFSKAAILEFYLNQVPYAARRRGVAQAARHYFDRDLDTLNLKEMMALAVLVRSPSRLDLRRGQQEIRLPIKFLAQRMKELGLLGEASYQALLEESLTLHRSVLPVRAEHFVNHIYRHYTKEDLSRRGRLRTSLDAALQRRVRAILDRRVKNLRAQGVHNGAALVVDHRLGEILAWVNAGDFFADIPGSQIDAVTTPRQPGSTLKPFLYALALEKGWTAATLINDAPLAQAVGTGLHSYHNYSRIYYGPLRLRDALGNSLNVPAVRAAQFIGHGVFLERLRRLGFDSLSEHPDFYGDGLALGNGAVTLLELVQGYAALANRGRRLPLKSLLDRDNPPGEQVFSPEVTSIIADILSDPDARRLEFGRGALLRFPVQTALKTGTSSDYRDAWAVGFNHRYTVGVWLGNLDQQPMARVSGASGPALVLRGLFAELNRHQESHSLYLSPKLVRVQICRQTGLRATPDCPSRGEWFLPGSEPTGTDPEPEPARPLEVRLSQPTEGLRLALDPRIPDQDEMFALSLPGDLQPRRVDWEVNGQVIGQTGPNVSRYLWPVSRGEHVARATVWLADNPPRQTPPVSFLVK